MMRFRVTYQKTEPLRYTGNLDLQKIWERYLRRANLPVAYSQGFHPQPRIQQASPLPLGFLSMDEQVDFYLNTDQISPETVTAQLETSPYPGISILRVKSVELTRPALSTRVVSAEYRVEFLDQVDLAELNQRVNALTTSTHLVRSRRGKNYDLRPLIEVLFLAPDMDNGTPAVFMQLAARQSATGRPEEVISALGYDPFSARYIRTRLIFLPD